MLPVCVSVGTYKMRDPPVLHSILDAALECGYRMVGKLFSSAFGTWTNLFQLGRHSCSVQERDAYREDT